MYGSMRVTLTVEMPWRDQIPIKYCHEISMQECRESFAPLPRDRELFESEDRRALLMKERRRSLSQYLARKMTTRIADEIVKAVESQDPQFGYSPEEWERINNG